MSVPCEVCENPVASSVLHFDDGGVLIVCERCTCPPIQVPLSERIVWTIPDWKESQSRSRE